MKIRFRKVTNIRSDNQSLGVAPLGIVYANTLLEVDGLIHEGATVNGDNRWWRDHNGWYYWAGETEAVMPEEGAISTTPSPTPSIPKPAIPTPVPTPTAVTEPIRPPVAAAELIVLPLPDDPFASAVPEGEWRSLDEETPPPTPTDTDRGEFESFQPTVPILPPPVPILPPPVPDLPDQILAPPDLLTPRAQRLNWGLETGQIPSHWWQEKRLTGRGVTLAILSTGIDAQHPDLNGIPSTSFFNTLDNQPIADSHGIGTQAAIVAAGKGNIAYGIAPEVKLLIAKIGSTPNDITPESLIAGLEWAITQKADIAALLVDFLELSEVQMQGLSDVIARAIDANIVLLAPVGNSSDRKPENRYPAALEGVISVGAHHSFNRRSDFSAKSYHLDFLAPGEGLNTSDLHQGFGVNLKNTVIATAFSAGFVALIRQWKKQQSEGYSPADLVAFLHETAHYEGINKGKDTEMGYGILNPQAVLEALTK